MRKVLILAVVVLATLAILAGGVQAAVCPPGTKPAVRTTAKHKKVVRHRAKRKAAVARAARGPMITCPAPVVNVPQGPAPVVNVPQGPAPVVNIPQAPTPVGVSSDDRFVYVLRGDQLTVIDKSNYQCTRTIPLPPAGAGMGAGPGMQQPVPSQ